MTTPAPTVPLATSLALLARLLSYPDADFDALMDQALATMDSLPLIAFGSAFGALSHDAREELYTATFDVTPSCVPYVSIHLFGEENFKRGEFMAALHSQYAQSGFETFDELPDHIAVLLRYAATLGEPARRELVEFCLLGPLVKITAALPGEHPYHFVLDAVVETLLTGYPGLQPPLSPLEQMRQHGGACPVVADGCNCGPVDNAAHSSARIIDGPDDLIAPDVRAPIATTPAPTL
ncbi:MAG: molecular chaperone TorD family protein [Verrucomicrobiota bacterium]